MRAWGAIFLFSSFALAGCSSDARKLESKEAVQKAIEAYLDQRQNLMLANMNLEVAEVKFEGETATAEVRFHSKQSSDLTVSVRYTLKRHGDGWQVETSAPAGGMGMSPHGMATPSAPAPAHGETPPASSH